MSAEPDYVAGVRDALTVFCGRCLGHAFSKGDLDT